MVEEAGVVINEDLEFLVQAERDASANSDMVTDEDDDKENKKDSLSRNVRFNSEHDIYMIENEPCFNSSKEGKCNTDNTGNNNHSEKSQEAPRRRTASFVWGKIRIGKQKMSQSDESDDKAQTEDADINSKEDENMVKAENEKDYGNQTVNEENKESTLELAAKSNVSLNIECQVKDDHFEEIIQLRSELDRPQSSLSESTYETSILRPRFYTESHRRPKDSQHYASKHTSNTPEHIKRERRTSTSSINSRDSLGSLNSSGVKDRIFYWKRSSSRSLKSVTISNPLCKDDMSNTETVPNDINSQIDKIANERLEAVYKYRQSADNDMRIPCEIPKKPIKFHMKQLEKMLNGFLQPPPRQNSMTEVQLRLDSMLVMQSLSCGPRASALYDVPRIIQLAL